ncbi:MAG: hypothetical protein ACTH9F_09825, partial [Brachybacterium tyrofermentans]
MALIHPRSLERWQEWQNSRYRARQIKHSVAGFLRRRGDDAKSPAPGFVLHSREGDEGPRVLIGLDSASPTSRASLLTALPYVRSGIDVLAPAGVDLPELAGSDWTHQRVAMPQAVLNGRGIGSVITLGWHLEVGRMVHEWALAEDIGGAVV